jgi:hypothetical protein
MYLRLKRRPIKKESSVCIEAVILESKRKGKTTSQQFITYLASIRQQHIQNIIPRIIFWDKVAHRLNTMNLPPDTRKRIEERLSSQIPQPTADERNWHQERLAQIKALRKKNIDKPRAKPKTGPLSITRRYSKQYPGG